MKIAVLISGGVDSSVVLSLLHQQGHDLTAFYLKIWLEEELSFLGECPWEDDLRHVRAVCEKFSVPLRIIPLQKEYYANVVSYTIEELKAGRTPSPDLFCNQKIKFGAFYEQIDSSFDKVATGHYAQVHLLNGRAFLTTSPDPIKDQTYFLAHLSNEQLQRALFPIGGMYKTQVRALAQQFNLPNKDRKDSQGICFLGKIKFSDFAGYHLGNKPGDIVDITTNKKLGDHEGFWYYTIGQRKGLGLGGGPWYVTKKDLENNIIYVANQKDLPRQFRNSFRVAGFHWINQPTTDILRIKIRHGEKFYKCQLKLLDHSQGEVIMIDDQEPGIAAGQFAVFYEDNSCLGCAKIQ